MKKWYIFLLVLLGFLTCGYSDEVQNIYISAIYQPNTQKLENIFKSNIPPDDDILYTIVPRGLIISVDEDYLFKKGQARLKLDCICMLDILASILRTIPNDCVVEDHTQNNDLTLSDYNSDWELAAGRSGNITQYLIQYGHIPPKRLFSVGYGQFMPFEDNVAPLKGMDNRIDFVILEYEARR